MTVEIAIGNALAWIQMIATVAVLLQTIEFLCIRDGFGQGGVWTWSVIREELSGWPSPLRRALDFLLGDQEFRVFLGCRLVAAACLLVWDIPALWIVLFLGTVLIALRWRGTFNGGSDYMMIIVLAALSVNAVWGGSEHPRIRNVCLGYVGIQVCLSFFVAGMVKIRQPLWRSGKALVGFLGSDYYGASAITRGFLRNGNTQLIRLAAWSVIVFEVLFPLAILDRRGCMVMIALALMFQLINTFVFGLNRFVWAWGAAYPALYSLCLLLENGRKP